MCPKAAPSARPVTKAVTTPVTPLLGSAFGFGVNGLRNGLIGVIGVTDLIDTRIDFHSLPFDRLSDKIADKFTLYVNSDSIHSTIAFTLL